MTRNSNNLAQTGLTANDQVIEAVESGRMVSTEVIDLPVGSVTGLRHGRVCEFKAIPYGHTTAGMSRFMPPVGLKRWNGVLECRTYGPACPQNNPDLDAWRDNGEASENCLVLNIWTPDLKPKQMIPVMVWLHGGAYSTGSGGLDLYDGASLAREQEVVVVSINHRLNIFGYLHLDGAHADFEDSANLGQQDIVLALRWIKENIACLGGDNSNVTIFGESGGGAKASVLCAMPSAAGLFHKVIIQSGSFLNVLTEEQAQLRAEHVLEYLGVETRNIRDIQKLSVERLLAAERNLTERFGLGAFWPVCDGVVIPEGAWERSAPHFVGDVPMLIGTTLDESAYFTPQSVFGTPPTDLTSLRKALLRCCEPFEVLGADILGLVDEYLAISEAGSYLDLLLEITSDVLFWRTALIQAEAQSEQAPVYMYRFDWKYPCFGGAYALHGAEIPFVFGNLDYELPAWDLHDSPAGRSAADPDNIRYELSRSMQHAWANFARTGQPSTPTLPNWPAFTPSRRATMIFDRTCCVCVDPGKQRRELLFRSTN